MSDDYMPIVILMILAAIIGSAIVALGWIFGPKKGNPYKLSTYESGMTPMGTARQRFPIKFYLVAMLFILFDIEVVFLWSWLAVFKNASLEYQIFSFWTVMIYLLLWVIGDAYILRINAIEWDESHSLEEARSGLLAGHESKETANSV